MSSRTHPVWSTSSLDQEADTSPTELAALSQHLGRLFALKCHGETVGRFVTLRVVITLSGSGRSTKWFPDS